MSVWLWPLPVLAAVAVAGQYGLVAGLSVAGGVVVLLAVIAGAELVVRRLRARRGVEPGTGVRTSESPTTPPAEEDRTVVSFRGANLRDAKLSGADLRYADLRGAILDGADLEKADLRGINTTPPTE